MVDTYSYLSLWGQKMLTFPSSKVKSFVHKNKALRWGQAFHQFMKLEKCHQDKHFCDKLYTADDDVAKSMVASRTDRNS